MNLNSKRIAANAVLNTAKTVLSIVFPLISFPYVSRVLGAETLGVYTFSSSVISYFLLLAALGISTYGIREGTQYRENREQVQQFVSEVFSINVISSVISYLLLFACLTLVPKLRYYLLPILILSLEIATTTLGVAWVCNIYEDFLYITLRSLAIQFVSLLLTLALVKSPRDIYVYIGIIVFAKSGSNIINFFYIRRRYCKFSFTLDVDWKRHLRPILIIFSTSVAITLYVSSDATMLGFMTSDFQVGLYGTSVKIYNLIKHILVAVLTVLIPQFSLMIAKGNKEESGVLFSRVFNILTTLMMPMAVGLFMLSKDIVLLIAGIEYLEAQNSLRLLSIAVLFSLYAYMFTNCILIPSRKETVVFKATLISAVINIGLNFVLIPLWGINAAAFTTIIAEFITFVIASMASRKEIQISGVTKNLITSVFGCCGIIAVCICAQRISMLFVRLFVSVAVSIAVYWICLHITGNDALSELADILGKKKKHFKNL